MSKKPASRRPEPISQDGEQALPAAPHIAIIYSRYNATITESMAMAAIETCMLRTGFSPAVFEAPGAYELTSLVMAAAQTGRYDGIVAIGCIIKGETSHDHHLASSVAHGLTNVTLLTDIPVAFGVLTTNTTAQAKDRAGLGKNPASNKGHEAMDALLDTLDTLLVIDNPEAAQIIESSPEPRTSDRPDKAASRNIKSSPAPRTKPASRKPAQRKPGGGS